MASEIYAKTELGVHELAEPALRLPVPLRKLLLLVDGTRTTEEVLVEARALKLDQRALTALERGGLIARHSSASTPPVATAAPAQRADEEHERFAQAQQMLSDAIDAHLGFGGYALTVRLQKTANVRDLHALLPDFARALVKRLGIEPAAPIVASIERLIMGT